jgi:foldase protein PrsA
MILERVYYYMNGIKRFGLLFMAIIIALSTAACGAVNVNPEKDKKRVVAEVNGDKILKEEFLELYNIQKSMLGITDEAESDASQKDNIKQVKSMVLDQVILNKIMYDKAKAAGFEVDENIKKETKEGILDEIEQNIKYQMYGEDDQPKEEELSKLVQQQYDASIKAYGLTEERFIELIAKQDQISKYRDKELENVQITDDDIKKYYDEQLKKQKENPDEAENQEVMLYRPAGWLNVKHILIKLPDDEIVEHSSLVANDKKDEAKKYLDEKLKAIKPKADEVLAKAKAGENFEDLIKEYSEDKGMDIEQGYILNKNSSFVESFKDAAFKLKKEGDMTDLVASEYGYHIIKLYEKMPEHVFTIDETRDEIKVVLDYQKKNEKWQSMVDAWKKEAKIKKYEKRL